jgi:hypothetical protein
MTRRFEPGVRFIRPGRARCPRSPSRSRRLRPRRTGGRWRRGRCRCQPRSWPRLRAPAAAIRTVRRAPSSGLAANMRRHRRCRRGGRSAARRAADAYLAWRWCLYVNLVVAVAGAGTVVLLRRQPASRQPADALAELAQVHSRRSPRGSAPRLLRGPSKRHLWAWRPAPALARPGGQHQQHPEMTRSARGTLSKKLAG